MENIIEKTCDFARNYFAEGSSGHGFDHIQRVYNNALLILTDYPKADAFLVKMVALLHDVDDYKLHTDGENTLRYLQTLGIDDDMIAKIIKTCGQIGFSKRKFERVECSSIEAKIVSDADMLEAMGAIGICRAIMYAASHGHSLFDATVFPKQDLNKADYVVDTGKNSFVINHFFDKPLRLKDYMQTNGGKKEAEKRHSFMVQFLEQFFSEIGAEDWHQYLLDYLSGKTKNTKG